MQFNESTNLTGLIQACERYTGQGNVSISGNTTPLKEFTARINEALDRFVYLALMSGGRWEFDDTNYTDYPVGTDDIVSGQQDYPFAGDVLVVKKVLVKNSSGVWDEIDQVSDTDRESEKLWELTSGNSGTPLRYDIFANSIWLDPIPNYNSTNGLKVMFQRNVDKFTSTDTTQEPGIPSIFHPYLARYASMLWLIERGIAIKNDLSAVIQNDEKAIQDFFGYRNKSQVNRMTPNTDSNK